MDLLFQDTVCAVSTAPGVGGIAVIRVSGKQALGICNNLLSVDVMAMAANTCRYARFTRRNGEVLDQVMVTVFHAPHCFTGEDTVEIACHGSRYIQQCILQELVGAGARLARAGEFTQRAFLNGRMDLSQAEAVADLIAADSRAAHRIALQQMRGGFSDELARLRAKLLDFTSLVELELDFADHEELEFADRSQLQDLAHEIESKIQRLCESFSLGNAIKNGIPVAIVGATNAGKSTLLNSLVGEEKAIVSDIHGTTRDVIEDCISIEGIQFRFADTAGLRDTSDTIENLGIERSYRSIDKAKIVLWLIDLTSLDAVNPEQIAAFIDRLQLSSDKSLIVVFNKIDKINQLDSRNQLSSAALQTKLLTESAKLLPASLAQVCAEHPHCFISAKHNIGIGHLRQELLQAAQIDESSLGDVTISNARHYENLTHALQAIRRVQEGLSIGLSGELLSMDLRDCIDHLGAITGGALATDEVLGNIFSKFCIGK